MSISAHDLPAKYQAQVCAQIYPHDHNHTSSAPVSEVRDSLGRLLSGHQLKKDRGWKMCKNCGKTFQVHTSAPKANFCCQPCAASHTGKITMAQNRRIVAPVKAVAQCAGCDEKIVFSPSAKRKYCSNKCAANSYDFKKRRVAALNARPDKSSDHSRSKKGWVEIGGKRFYARSRWEANYGRYLEWQRACGSIAKWEHEPETFWFEGIKRGCCSYLPDFRVTHSAGRVEYHEVKGWMDSKSKTKIRRMAKYHPEVNLVVIDSKRYRVLAKQLKNIVPGWDSEQVAHKDQEKTVIEVTP